MRVRTRSMNGFGRLLLLKCAGKRHVGVAVASLGLIGAMKRCCEPLKLVRYRPAHATRLLR